MRVIITEYYLVEKFEDAIHNTRVLDGQSDKKNPQDFALWKKADERHIMRWPLHGQRVFLDGILSVL